MKFRTLLILFVAFSLMAEQPGLNIVLKWSDPNPRETKVTGYKIYQSKSTNDSSFTYLRYTSSTSAVLSDVKPGYYRWKVTAINMWGESAMSVETNTPPSVPLSVTNLNYLTNRTTSK